MITIKCFLIQVISTIFKPFICVYYYVNHNFHTYSQKGIYSEIHPVKKKNPKTLVQYVSIQLVFRKCLQKLSFLWLA